MLKNITSKALTSSLYVLRPWLTILIAVMAGWGLWAALLDSPQDYQQFQSVRILYIHVPAAWLAMALYFGIGVGSLIGLITGNRLYVVMAQALAPIGLTYTLICLATGMIWGQPIWGTFWVWDARLTSMAILAFLYLGYIMIHAQSDPYHTSDRAGAMIALLGCINLPIIKWSVDWWTTLHQPASILRQGGPALDNSMLLPLAVMFVAYAALTLLLWLMQCESLILKQKVYRLMLQAAARD